MFKDIIDRLELRYPNVLPKKMVNDYELGVLIGQQQVIQFIKEFEDSLKPKGTK